MIGLKKNSVKVVNHIPEWISLGYEICHEIQRTCGNLVVEVQHVGSTAVPDLPAKPIVDIAVAVDSFDLIPKLILKLTDIGYLYRGMLSELLGKPKDSGNIDSHLFIKESSPEIHTTYLHIVKHRSTEWIDYIHFRDILRRDSNIRNQYGKLKQDLLDKYPNDRKLYTGSKHSFIQKVLGSLKAQSDFNKLVKSIKQAGDIKKGKISPSRRYEFAPPDIKQIRKRLNKSQSEFAFMIGVSISTLQNWEQGRRKPDGPARALLQVASKNPDAVIEALMQV